MTPLPMKTRATYSWSGNKNTKELGFMEGDVIEILSVVNDGVYFGESQRTKLRGFFPSKYVECNLSATDDRRNSSSTIHVPKPTSKRDNSKRDSSNSLFTLKRNDKSSSSTLDTDLFDGSLIERQSALQKSHKLTVPKQSKKFNSSYVQQLLDSSTLSTDTGTSSAFGHSDFSATSAGSYMRHKEEFESKLQAMVSSTNTSNQTRQTLNEIIERNEKRKHPKIFRDLLGSKEEPGPSFDDRLYLSSLTKMSQMSFDESIMTDYTLASSKSMPTPIPSNLKRSKTVSGAERAKRSQRVLKEQPDLILKPQETISHVNYEERDTSSRKISYSLDSVDLRQVDNYIKKIEHNPYTTPQKFTIEKILNTFTNQLEISRAIYSYLTKNFSLIKRKDERMSTKKMFESEKISEIMHNCACTPHQLTWIFYLMADCAGLEVELVLGYLKHPFVLNETITDAKKRLIINHSWISINIEGEYRFIDVALGNPTNELSKNYPDIWDPHTNWEFYFLAKPFHIVNTHSPRYIDQQHIVPPIDVVAQLSLPPLYSNSIISGVKWHKYNSSIFHLKDYELYDFELEIPSSYIVQGKFTPYDDTFETTDCFVQVYFKNDVRIAHFQGIMPKSCPAGFIYVIGKNEFSKKWNLLLSIPCFHQGKWKPLNWVKKVPGLPGVDVYVKEPKIGNLKCEEQFFDIKINAKKEWINEVKEFYKGTLKIGLFMPNKQIIELDVNDGRFSGYINLDSPGSWRLGVLDVKLMRWKVIAEWIVS